MKESILRTLVPVIYGLLLDSGIGKVLGLDDKWVQGAAAAIATGIIYVILRYLESHQALFGWLLGYPAQPSYGAPAIPGKRKRRSPTVDRGYADPRTVGIMGLLFGSLAAAFTSLYLVSIVVVGLLMIGAIYFMIKHPVRQPSPPADRIPVAVRSASARSSRAQAARAPRVAGVHGKL